MITYDNFWKTLKKRNISQYELINTYKISRGLLYRMKNNESITTHTLNELCDILECDILDIIQYKRNTSFETKE